MRILIRALYGVAAGLVFALTTYLPVQGQNRIEDRFANVHGIRLHYLVAGKGAPVILLHGYAENSHMWRPLMVELAKSRTVIAPDLRGFGQSSKPTTGYDKKTMAQGYSCFGPITRLST
jgi:pimeloyl-ACP methyl ester carboxylesterase